MSCNFLAISCKFLAISCNFFLVCLPFSYFRIIVAASSSCLYFNALFKYIYVLYLKFRQIFNRLKRKYIKRAINISPSPSVSIISRKPQSFVSGQSRMLGENRFQFLNVTADVEKADDWNLTNQDKLWLYNLHYFDDLNAIEAIQRASWHANLIERWIYENPPGYGNGWEAYPSSLRIINWIKWLLI